MSDPDRLVLVAEADGQLVGWAKTHFRDHADGPASAAHYLGGVTGAPRWRRQGTTASPKQERLDWIWARSHDACYVGNAENDASIEPHRRWRFARVAEGRVSTRRLSLGDGDYSFGPNNQLAIPITKFAQGSGLVVSE